ncbi:MAG TPA: dihydrofolate reductase family protein [Pseudonocardia sp.]
MATLIYSSIASLDGYIADEDGKFDWSMPDPEVHAAVNDVMRSIGTHLYGRRLYETMSAWETLDLTDESAVARDFAEVWRAADKIVYSTTLTTAATAHTRIEPRFAADDVAALKANAHRDLLIGGADLAGQALAAGLVDEIQLFLCPVVVGGGTAALPRGVRLDLELLDERRFASGFVNLHYRCVNSRH